MAKKTTTDGNTTVTEDPTKKTEATPKVSDAIAGIAKKTLANYPNLKEVHVTSDGTAFGNHGDAKNHARTLKDTNVVTIKRDK